jgi:hypothetical protein
MTNNNLLQIIEPIEALISQKKDIEEYLKESFANAKALGFDVKTIKKLIKIRENPDKFKAELAELRLYAESVQLELF